ncbi:hypothetical protein P691DRAFT_759636 [Macrolepiota fuliginosa MF-IS2]|uniref:Uncharacterized protein n=1 Tax=Macrolepiota fuliginosa MF-IS2 TaxID=1400762 RepID=A0A9P6C1R0_9AGAR|nr:hypothetical protein P691DRAFT_759636 [Macrolepiota fuliginosa MF-IS2]
MASAYIESSSSPWAQSSLLSGVSSRRSSTSPATSPSLVQHEEKDLPVETRDPDVFTEELHARLLLLHTQQDPPADNHARRISRWPLHPLLYQRSQSLYLGLRSYTFPRRRASRGSCQFGDPTQEVVSSLKRKFSQLENPAQASISLDQQIEHQSRKRAKHEELIPTAPATPRGNSLSSIPIISPPYLPVPRFPLSASTTAKIKIGKYKEREGRTAHHDYMRCHNAMSGTHAAGLGLAENWEIFLGLGKQDREKRVDWLLQYLPEDDLESSLNSSSSFCSTISPGPRFCSSGSRQNLINQLATSPETRFHAGWMFLRYHYLLALNRVHDITQGQLPLYPGSGIWDVAIASLAISVKFHRDFLFPLLPVEASDYMDISPHAMGYQEFEYAQRAILDAFSYELGVTPQPFLDQTWTALSSLRELLDFDGGWNQVRKETWRILLGSLYEPDVMQFSVSVLTATALSKAVISVLAQRYYYESDWNSFFNFARRLEDRRKASSIAQRFSALAEDNAEGVIMDIQAVIGVSDEEFNELGPNDMKLVRRFRKRKHNPDDKGTSDGEQDALTTDVNLDISRPPPSSSSQYASDQSNTPSHHSPIPQSPTVHPSIHHTSHHAQTLTDSRTVDVARPSSQSSSAGAFTNLADDRTSQSPTNNFAGIN